MQHSIPSNSINKKKALFTTDTQAIERIGICLYHWARWVKVQHNYGLGFPSESPINRLMREGICSRKAYSIRIPDDPDAEHTEATIRDMPKHLRNVIEQYYLRSGSIEHKAREVGMSRVTFYEYLRMAKYWLLGKWS